MSTTSVPTKQPDLLDYRASGNQPHDEPPNLLYRALLFKMPHVIIPFPHVVFKPQTTTKQQYFLNKQSKHPVHTCIKASTLSCTMAGGLFLGDMIFTKTPSMKSRVVTSVWNRYPQFFTHVSRT